MLPCPPNQLGRITGTNTNGSVNVRLDDGSEFGGLPLRLAPSVEPGEIVAVMFRDGDWAEGVAYAVTFEGFPETPTGEVN